MVRLYGTHVFIQNDYDCEYMINGTTYTTWFDSYVILVVVLLLL